jgi:hypothetical protein
MQIDPSKKADTTEVTFEDCAKTPAIKHWSLSQKERNAEQHASNGNGSVAATGAGLIGHALATTHSAAQFGEMLRKVVPAIKGACKAAQLPEAVTESATEAFVTAAWDHTLAHTGHEDSVLVHKPQPVLVEVCGATTVGEILQGETLLELVHRLCRIPTASLLKLAVYQVGKPAQWSDKAASESVSVRGRLLGGASISRSERIIDRITKAEGLQPTSRGALTAVLDPFHDHDYRVVGLPDAMAGASVTELYKQTFSITTNQGSDANWDCNIVLDPDVLTYGVSLHSRKVSGPALTNKYSNTTPAYGLAGGITAYGTTTGTDMSLATNTVVINRSTIPCQYGLNGLSASTVPGSYRVFGISMEIENSTAPLYQQGNVIVWRQPMPNPSDATASTVSFGFSTFGVVSTLVVPQPPGSAAEAMLLSGSRQWHSKEGAMVVMTPNSGEFPVLNSQCVGAMAYEDDPTGTIYAGLSALTIDGGGDPPINAYPATARTPFNQSGAFFTGLSPQTVLNVNVRTWIEIFPSQINNPLTPLAQPSAPYDEVFWRIYSECIKDMPPGVMLKENGLGDWLSDIAGKVGNFISPIAKAVSGIASFIPHPAAQGIARAAGMVGGVAEQVGARYGTPAPSSAQLRDDGVQEAIQAERAMMRSEQRARPAPRLLLPKPTRPANKPRKVIGTSTALVKYRKR